jgi:hypothetical protein
MNSSKVTVEQIVHEVDDLHNLFLAWYAGKPARNRDWYDLNIAARMDTQFSIVSPSGITLAHDEILMLIYEGHGQSKEFRINTRNAKLLRRDGNIVLVSYEEWQHHAVNSPASQNGRISTALLAVDEAQANGLRWLHVHETWLPDEIQKTGNYDF